VRRRPSALAGLWLCAGGCGLFDLPSQITLQTCDSDTQCEVLNDPNMREVDPCQPYRCGEQHVCEMAPLDVDRDGFSPLSCERDPSRVDCNDLNASVYPQAREYCDDEDDDCDARIDEGVLEIEQTAAVEFGTEGPSSEITYTMNFDRSLVGLAYSLGRDPPSIAINQLAASSRAADTPIVLDFDALRAENGLPRPKAGAFHASAAAIGFRQPDTTLLAGYLRDAPERIVVGTLAPPSPVLFANVQIASYGLSCARSESCAANADDPPSAIATPASTAPRIAAGADGTVVVYARDTQPEVDVCNGEGASKAVLANLMGQNSSGFVEAGRAALELGTSTQARAPALLSLPWLTANGVSYGWLVGYPEPGGALLIVQMSGRGKLQVTEPLLRLRSEDGPLHSAQFGLGRGPDQAQHVMLGVSAVRGCGPDSRAVFGILEGVLQPDGSLGLRLPSPLIELGGDDAQREPALAFREDPDVRRRSWAVAFRDETGLRVRLLSEGGKLLGDEPYLALGSGLLGGETSGLISLRSNREWFALYSLTRPDAQNPARVIRNALHSCL
jgi:hypothetical protein